MCGLLFVLPGSLCTWAGELALPGDVVAFETADLQARIAGYVEKWTVDIGDKVNKGQVLAELDVPELKAEVQEKQARVVQARARVESREAAGQVAEAAVAVAHSQKLEAQASLLRARAAFERSKGRLERMRLLEKQAAITKELLAQAQSQQEADRASLDQAEAQVRTAEATIKGAQARLAQCQAEVKEVAAGVEVARLALARSQAVLSFAQIRAPFDGVVASRNVNTGDFVSPPEPAGKSLPLFRIERIDRVRVVIHVPEKEVARTKVGTPALVQVSAVSDEKIKGAITRTSWALDEKQRTLRAVIDLPNPAGQLLPGMFAQVTLQVK